MPLNKVATLHWTATYNVTMLGTHTYTTHEKFAIHSPVHGYLGLARLVQQWKVANHYIQVRVQFTLTLTHFWCITAEITCWCSPKITNF